MPVRMVIERGTRGNKAAAFAVDWPGWSRGGKTGELAVEALEVYRERYRPIAVKAGLKDEFDRAGRLKTIEDHIGTGSTDYWGISFAPASSEKEPMSADDFARKIKLLKASWSYFDKVAASVSAEMAKGPRGGGRDRDRIIRHVIRNESEEFAKYVGLRIPEEGALTAEGLRAHRKSYVAAMRAYNAGKGKRMKNWNLPFLIRHSAYHTLDHAWEMEDKDLSG